MLKLFIRLSSAKEHLGPHPTLAAIPVDSMMKHLEFRQKAARDWKATDSGFHALEFFPCHSILLIDTEDPGTDFFAPLLTSGTDPLWTLHQQGWFVADIPVPSQLTIPFDLAVERHALGSFQYRFRACEDVFTSDDVGYLALVHELARSKKET